MLPIKEDGMDRTFSMHGAKKLMHTEFRWESQKERYHQEDLDIGGRVILFAKDRD
jgi:hypothetical protein